MNNLIVQTELFQTPDWLDWRIHTHTHTHTHTYIYIYEVHTISFQTFFVWAFEYVLDSVCYCYTSYELTYQFLWFQIQINSWWISKMQPDILVERYAIKFSFKLGKNATGMYGMLQTAFDHLAWIEHQFLSGIRDSRKSRTCKGWWEVWEE